MFCLDVSDSGGGSSCLFGRKVSKQETEVWWSHVVVSSNNRVSNDVELPLRPLSLGNPRPSLPDPTDLNGHSFPLAHSPLTKKLQICARFRLYIGSLLAMLLSISLPADVDRIESPIAPADEADGLSAS